MKIKQITDTFLKDIGSSGSLIAYILLVLFAIGTSKELAVKLIFGFFLIHLTIISIRLIYFKNRPIEQKYSSLIERIDASSFPSIHSARITFIAIIFSIYISQIYFSCLLFFIATLVCYSRYYLKRHYIFDIIGGIVLGVIFSILIKFIGIA